MTERVDVVEVLAESAENKETAEMSAEAAEMSKLTERVDAVEVLVENAESAEAKEELRPKLATLREQIKDLTEGYETRMQEVQERNKQFFQELKYLQNRMNRRDERLSQEVPDLKGNQS